jgi:hypothetical protein
MRKTRLIASVGVGVLLLGGVALLVSGVGVAQASRITPILGAAPAFLGAGLGTATGTATTVAPNNNNSNPSANTIILDESFAALGPIDAVFSLTATGGNTEYFLTLTATNNTSSAWTDFHLQLMPTAADDNLDFDLVQRDPTPTSTSYATLAHLEDTIDWSGGSVPAGGTTTFTLSIDTPDPLLQFALRALPTTTDAVTPEPGIVLLTGSGLLGLVGYGWWRGKRTS